MTLPTLLAASALGLAARPSGAGGPVAHGSDRAFSHTIVTAATPGALWAVWTDVAAWPEWDVELDSARLDGPFVSGVTGRLVPTRGPSARFRIEDVDEGNAYTLVTLIPLGSLQVRRTWTARGDEIAVTHEVSFQGVGGRLLSGRLGPGFRRALPVAMERLCALAEARS